jgi:hypothetical protein
MRLRPAIADARSPGRGKKLLDFSVWIEDGEQFGAAQEVRFRQTSANNRMNQ